MKFDGFNFKMYDNNKTYTSLLLTSENIGMEVLQKMQEVPTTGDT